MAQETTSQLNTAQGWIGQMAQSGTLPHSLLFWGDGDLTAVARYGAMAYQCQQSHPPCGRCIPCEKVQKGIHPDVTVVEDPSHKMIGVDVVREVRQSAFVCPNEGQRKVYVFPDGALLSVQDQNVLLKLVEEGPGYCAFIFCVENLDQVLPTLRSRCVCVYVGQEAQPEAEVSAMAVDLCQALLGKKGALTRWAVKSEGQKPTRQGLETCLQDSRRVCVQALAVRQTGRSAPTPLVQQVAQGLSAQRLAKTIHMLQTYYTQCAYNIGVSHTLGALAIELEENP